MAVTSAVGSDVRLHAIAEADVPAVAEFMHLKLNDRVPVADWERAVDVPWSAEQPNAGFVLLDDGVIVGAHLAFYSERIIEGRLERFCNLGAWCVLPTYRFHAVRLLKALLAQDGFHFTDLSPSGSVVALNTRLGFRFLDTATTVVPNLPWPSRPRRDTISSDPAIIEQTLVGTELKHFRDHAGAAAAHNLLLMRGDEWCYVVFRKDRRKGLRLFGSILYVSNPELFRAMARQLARHLLLRHRIAATLIERAVVDYRTRLSLTVDSPRRKMFRSSTLEPSQIDYLYSELVCLSW
jgi:hypothetical protein